MGAKYIVFEGIDGCGKSTQISTIKAHLVTLGKDVLTFREPTKESDSGKKLREMFNNGQRPSHNEELKLFMQDRRWLMLNRIQHALALDVIVLQDRSYFSNAAYQHKPGVLTFRDIIEQNERFSYIPDVVILLDLDVTIALSRVTSRGAGTTAMEKIDNLQRVREAYIDIYNEYRTSRNIVLIDANRNVDEITERILSTLKKASVF